MSNQDIISFYSTNQNGGDLPYFVGKQYGSGWLKSIGRFALPILKRLGGVAVKTATDVLKNDSRILPTLKNYAMEEVGNILPGVVDAFQNKNNPCPTTAEGLKRRKILQNDRNKRRKLNTIFKK